MIRLIYSLLYDTFYDRYKQRTNDRTFWEYMYTYSIYKSTIYQ